LIGSLYKFAVNTLEQKTRGRFRPLYSVARYYRDAKTYIAVPVTKM